MKDRKSKACQDSSLSSSSVQNSQDATWNSLMQNCRNYVFPLGKHNTSSAGLRLYAYARYGPAIHRKDAVDVSKSSSCVNNESTHAENSSTLTLPNPRGQPLHEFEHRCVLEQELPLLLNDVYGSVLSVQAPVIQKSLLSRIEANAVVGKLLRERHSAFDNAVSLTHDELEQLFTVAYQNISRRTHTKLYACASECPGKLTGKTGKDRAAPVALDHHAFPPKLPDVVDSSGAVYLNKSQKTDMARSKVNEYFSDLSKVVLNFRDEKVISLKHAIPASRCDRLVMEKK